MSDVAATRAVQMMPTGIGAPTIARTGSSPDVDELLKAVPDKYLPQGPARWVDEPVGTYHDTIFEKRRLRSDKQVRVEMPIVPVSPLSKGQKFHQIEQVAPGMADLFETGVKEAVDLSVAARAQHDLPFFPAYGVWQATDGATYVSALLTRHPTFGDVGFSLTQPLHTSAWIEFSNPALKAIVSKERLHNLLQTAAHVIPIA